MKKIYELKEIPQPSSRPLEMRVLQDIVDRPFMFEDAMRVLTPAHFASPDTRNCWEVIVKKREAGEELEALGLFGQVDQQIATQLLSGESADRSQSEIKADISALTEAAIKSRGYRLGLALAAATSKGVIPADEISRMIEEYYHDVKEVAAHSDHAVRLPDAMDQLAENLKRMEELARENKSLRKRTGLMTLDFATNGGFADGELVVLAARPSVGKTATALHIARNMALSRKIPVAFFSLEMSSESLTSRMMYAVTTLDPASVIGGKVDWAQVQMAQGMFRDAPMLIDTRSNTADQIISAIKKYIRRGECAIAFIDYLGLIKTAGRVENRAQEVGEITRSLKLAAVELGIPIVLLSQLNRENVSSNKEPQLYNLRESGSIEQDADIVLMLHPIEDADDPSKKKVRMFIRKNRNGKAGEYLDLIPNETYTAFKEDRGEVTEPVYRPETITQQLEGELFN